MSKGEKMRWVREQLLAGKEISSFQAIISVRYSRLASGIFKLKKKGWDIETTMRTKDNGDQYAIYKLLNKEEL